MTTPRFDITEVGISQLLLNRFLGQTVLPAAAADPAAALLAAVPTVNDGDVITAEHHNALRAAVEYLLGRGGQVGASVLTFAPALLPLGDQAPWRTGTDGAWAPDADTYAGWMPLDLPHGMLIDSVTVEGRIPDPGDGKWVIELGRRDPGARGPETLYEEILTRDAVRAGEFERSLPLVGAGTPAQNVARRRIDRTRYHYWFATAVAPPLSAAGIGVQLQAVRVGLTPDT